MPESPKQDVKRADRILDAAAGLLLRMGYRKVTIEDIARQADVGKGTVYLHWRTKDQLFEALLLRESADLMSELLDRLREDPAEIRPHRFQRAAWLASIRRPLVNALFSGNAELLGKLRDTSLRKKELLATERMFDLMTGRGLLRDDVPNLIYAMQATLGGFYLFENLRTTLGLDLQADGVAKLEEETKADALAHIIRHAFESPEEPDPETLAATAAELGAVYEELITSYRTWIYSPRQEPG